MFIHTHLFCPLIGVNIVLLNECFLPWSSPYSYITMNSLCDTTAREDSLLMSVHLEYNLIDRRLIPPTAFSCIKTYQSVLLRPQRYEEHQKWKPHRASSLQSILVQAIIQRFQWSNNADAVPFFTLEAFHFVLVVFYGCSDSLLFCLNGATHAHAHALFCALLQLQSTADIYCLTLASAVFKTDLYGSVLHRFTFTWRIFSVALVCSSCFTLSYLMSVLLFFYTCMSAIYIFL